MVNINDMDHTMDYKKAVITHLTDLKNQLDEGELATDILNKRSRLIIMTQTLMIEGEVNLFNSDERVKTFLEYGLEKLEDELNALPRDMDVLNLKAPVHIKHARVKPLGFSGRMIEMDEMLVFADQIVGLAVKSN